MRRLLLFFRSAGIGYAYGKYLKGNYDYAWCLVIDIAKKSLSNNDLLNFSEAMHISLEFLKDKEDLYRAHVWIELVEISQCNLPAMVEDISDFKNNFNNRAEYESCMAIAARIIY